MEKLMNYILKVSLLIVIAFSATVNAKNCSRPEKMAANLILLGIQEDQEEKNSLLEYHMPFGVHESKEASSNETLFYQKGFLAMHDPDLRTSLWTSYRLTKTDLLGMKGKKRVNCFRTDPRLNKEYTGMASDYNEAIFDQGHLTPDSDLKDRFYDQLNSYTYVNMAPQFCHFNRGIWLNLEHLTRKLAYAEGEVFITSGAIFDRDNAGGRDDDSEAIRMVSRNGRSRVAVPSHFYKVILKYDGLKWKSLAFLLPHNNEDHGSSWSKSKSYAMSNIVNLEVIEEKASVTLFPELERSRINQESSLWDLSKAGNGMTGRCK